MLTLLSFLVLPMATIPIFGSITGFGVAGLSAQFGVLGLLWLIPLVAAAVVGIAAWQITGTSSTPQTRRTGSIAIMALAGLAVLDYFIVLAAVQTEISREGGANLGVSAANFIGAGFWFALIGILAAVIGARAEMQSYRPAAPGSDRRGPEKVGP